MKLFPPALWMATWAVRSFCAAGYVWASYRTFTDVWPVDPLIAFTAGAACLVTAAVVVGIFDKGIR